MPQTPISSFDDAYTTLARSAGDDLMDFVVLEGVTLAPEDALRERVPMDRVLEAAEWMAKQSHADTGRPYPPEDGVTTEFLLDIAGQVKADVMECWWHAQGTEWVKQPDHRARVIAFIEDKKGSALDLPAGTS